MVRIAADADIFTAVAEPSRRAILDLLASGERAVNDVVSALRLAQPQVSKHLRVLRAAGLVSVRSVGRRRLYRVNGARLKAVHDWSGTFDRFWEQQIDDVRSRAERRALARVSCRVQGACPMASKVAL